MRSRRGHPLAEAEAQAEAEEVALAVPEPRGPLGDFPGRSSLGVRPSLAAYHAFARSRSRAGILAATSLVASISSLLLRPTVPTAVRTGVRAPATSGLRGRSR